MGRTTTHAQRWVDHSNERARKHGAPGVLRYADIPTLPVGPCAYCGGESRGWDHVVPLVQGGENGLSNLVPSCLPCNRRKSGRTPSQMAPLTLLCGWCWSPVTRTHQHVATTTRQGRRYVTCGRPCRDRLQAWRYWMGRTFGLPGGMFA